MALAHNPPNTIWLGGEITKLNEHVGSATITPGMLIEFHDSSGKMKLRPHASATENASSIFALEKTIHNKTVADTYAANELVLAAMFHKGSSVWALVPSGQNIVAGDLLQSNGDGKLKKATATTADANLANFQALESSGGAVTEDTRLRVQVLR